MESLRAEGENINKILKFLGYHECFSRNKDVSNAVHDCWVLQYCGKEVQDKVWKRHGPWEKQHLNNLTITAFRSDKIKGDLATCYSLLRESQLGALAGDVLFWDSCNISPTHRQVHYCSVFPAPMEKRDFCISELTGILEDNSLVLMNFDANSDGLIRSRFPATDSNEEQLQKYLSSPYIHGNVFFSVYHLEQLDESHFQLTRFFCLDMKLTWFFPRVLQEKALCDVFKQNIDWIRGQLRGYKKHEDLPPGYQEVMEREEIYSLLIPTMTKEEKH